MIAIVEQLSANVQGFLEQITEANGYPFDVARVHRARQQGAEEYATEDKAVTLITRSRQRREPDATENNSSNNEWLQNFEAIGVRKLSDASTTAQDSATNEFAAAIEQALGANLSHDGSTAEGYIIDTLISSVEPLDPSDGGYCGVRVAFEVHYRNPLGSAFYNASAITASAVEVNLCGALVTMNAGVRAGILDPDGWDIVKGGMRYNVEYAMATGAKVLLASAGPGTASGLADQVIYDPSAGTADLIGLGGEVVSGFSIEE